MNAEELRIGNFVNVKGSISQIELSHFLQLAECVIFEEDLQPIPITEEWHNKFGVKKNGFHNFEYFISDRQIICFSTDYVYLRDLHKKNMTPNDDICVIWNKDFKKRDMYLHEFQNLYFALTGNELTIKD